MTVSRRIARFAHELQLASVPEPVRNAARSRILDALGVGLAAASLPEGARWNEAARALGTGNSSSAWGFAGKLPAASAALLNGSLVHSLEYDDTHRASIVHGSSVVVPAALAAAEQAEASGEELLRAVIAGWETFIRLGLAAPGEFQKRGFQITAVGGPFIAALIGSLLARSSVDQTVAAMGIAGSQSSGVFEFLSNGASVKAMHPGWAAHAGLAASVFARQGITGPETVFEGKFGFYAAYAGNRDAANSFSELVNNLGKEWYLTEVSVKLHPCCHYNHPFLECLESLCAQGLTADNLDELICTGPQGEAMVIAEPWDRKCAPGSGYDAKFSLPYCLAWRLLHGTVTVDTFAQDPDQKVIALARRMKWVGTEDSGFPNCFPALLDGKTKDGKRLAASVPDVLGSPERPAPAGALQAKFRANAARRLAPEAVEGLIESVGRLESLPRLDPITRSLSRPV